MQIFFFQIKCGFAISCDYCYRMWMFTYKLLVGNILLLYL